MSINVYAPSSEANALELISAVANAADVKVNVDNPGAIPAGTFNLKGVYPITNTAAGTLFGADAIAYYIAGLNPAKNLLGSFSENAAIQQWISFAAKEVEAPGKAWLAPIESKKIIYNDSVYKAAKRMVTKACSTLDTYLSYRTFLVGQRITLADITVAAAFKPLVTKVLGPGPLKRLVNFVRWLNTIYNQCCVKKAFGEVVFCTKEAKAPKPVEKKKKDAPKKKAPKKKHPLELLPPSSLSLDAAKKAYSNAPDDKAAFWADFFENMYDPEGYSFWEMKWRYNEENTVLFKTQNQVIGFNQRADACRRWAMGVQTISAESEEKGPYNIAGCWLFRGQEMIPEMKEHVSAEYFDWKKIDTSTAEGRDLVCAYFSVGEVDPIGPVLDRRVFK